MATVEWVLPGDLRLPPSRQDADPFKLADHVRRYQDSVAGMPPIEVNRCRGGLLLISNGVTRATRAFRFCAPGTLVPVVVTEELPTRDVSGFPRVRDR